MSAVSTREVSTHAQRRVPPLTAPPLIAHVVFRFDIGGLENGLVNLLNRLPRDRYRHAVVSLTDVTGFASRVRRDDVRFIALNKTPGHGFALWPRLTRLFRQLRPSLVHTRNIAALEAVVPAALAGVPVRIHGEHGWDAREVGRIDRRYRITRYAYRPFVSHFVALSSQIESHLTNTIGVPRCRITRIVNGVDTQVFRPRRQRDPIEACPFGADDWLIGTVGRLQPGKNLIALLQSVAQLRRQPNGSTLRAAIVGEGPERAQLERAAFELGIADSVWFAGARRDVDAVMRGLDCFVLPSLAEGISNTVLEAMASGLPIVASDIDGNRELLDPGVTGLLVPPTDVGALTAAIGEVATNQVLAARLATSARSTCEQRFSLERMVNDYVALYDRHLLQRQSLALPAASS